MKSKKHILILTPGFPKSESDSTCIPALQAMVRELQTRHGDSLYINVVAFQYPFERGTYNWNATSCWSAGGKNKTIPGKIITWLRVVNHIWKLHRKQKVDVVHSFWLHDCTLVGQWFSKLTGAKLLAHAMGQDVLAVNPYIRFLNSNIFKVIANSPFTSQLLNTEFKIQAYRTIPFGIQTSDFTSIPTVERKIDLLSVGSLTTTKNHLEFVEIFAKLKQRFPSLTGSIIGAGPLMDLLRQQIKDLGIEDSLQLEGELSRREVLLRMSESKILLHTAPFESAAYVFLEALYSGMKVVCYQTGFLPDVPAAHPCKGKNELLETIQNLLAEKQEYTSASVPLIEETTDAVFKLYQNNS